MYIKLLGAGICFVLSLFNILGAMQQIPVKTTVGDSSRPAVAMMKPPGANLNLLSGGVFFAASIGLIAWAIWEYNSNVAIDTSDVPVAPVIPPMPDTDIQTPQYLNIETTQLQGGIKSKPLNQNIIPFRRTADGSVPISQDEFKKVLEEEDFWSDK
ncbi:hypothetical protein [Calothrix sp. CCY 0018]|uniref:hypothetical protein n=1 Tax=Calothrix sp. CCY 0018 TaxID=3103864 RepID=UPI0039C67408